MRPAFWGLVVAALVPQDAPVERLVEALRSDQVEERNRAELELKLRGDAVLDRVKPLAKDSDPEIATRARAILEAVEALRPVTPALSRAIPDVRRRLASSDPRAWTRVFLEATEQTGAKRRHPALGRDDFLPLAARALRAAERAEVARVAAIVAAWQLRPAAPELVRWLDEPDWNVRQVVFDAVESCKARELAPALFERYRRAQDSEKGSWLGLLARLGCREVVPDLAAQILSTRPPHGFSVGTAAYGYLAQLDGFEAMPALLRVLRQGHGVHELIPVLSLLAPDEILPALTADLQGSDGGARTLALNTLALYYPARAALPHLLKLADDPDPAIRSQALTAIAHLRMRDQLPELRKRLDDPAVGVRRTAAQLLAGFGDKSGLPELVLAIRHPTARTGAMSALRQLGAREAADELLPLLKDSEVRGVAADVLGALQVREAHGAIVAMLKDADVEVRRNAAVAITNLEGAGGIPRLLSLLDDPESNVQWTAAQMLTYLKAKEAVPKFAEWARSTDPHRRSSALWHLMSATPDEAVPVLIRTLEDPVPFVRTTAAEHLARLNRTEAAPLLKVLLRDPNAHTRRAAATSLVWLGDREGVPLILKQPHYPGTRFELNLLRRPEVCRAWRAKVLKGPDLVGSPREHLEEVCRRAGIELEIFPDLAWSWHQIHLPVDGANLLTVVSNLLFGTGGAVVEEGRLRVMAPREGQRFWVRWWAEELLRSARKDDQDEGKELLAELDLSESLLQAWKQKGRAGVQPPSPEEVRSWLTPGLKAVPGLEERLVKGSDEVWMKAFLHAAESYAHREYKGLADADFEVLGPRALQGALSPDEIHRVLQICARRRLRSVRPLAERYLTHAAAAVRVQAAHVILAVDGVKALPSAVALLNDPDGAARQGIVEVLGGLRMVEAGPEIMARKDDPSVLAGILKIAGDLNLEEALPLLLANARRVKGGRDPYMDRMTIGFQLYQIGNPSVRGELRECLKTEDHPNAVQTLLGLLSMWGARDAVPEIVDLATNRRRMGEMYQSDVFRALVKLGARDEAPLILRHLDPEKFQAGAAEAAGQMGLKDAVAPLRKLLAQDLPSVLPSVAVALGRLGDRGSLERLRALTAHKEVAVRGAAAHALALLGDRGSYDRLIALAGQPESHPPDFSEALALIPTAPARAALARRHNAYGPRVLSALAKGGAEESASLRVRLENEDVWTRWGGAQALGRIEGAETLADLRRMLKDVSPDVRQAASQMLCRRGAAEGVPGAWEHATGRFAALPFDLNGVRNPDGWARLKSAKLTRPFYGPVRELMDAVASAAGLRLEGLAAESQEYPAWANVYIRIHEAELPVSGLEAIERMDQIRWTAIVETDRVRILPRKEAMAFWKEWCEREKR